ncbi:hypothetical protein FHG87_025207, partial [Trinorchestia longiramus]
MLSPFKLTRQPMSTPRRRRSWYFLCLLELLSQKQFSMNDCFAPHSYPKCNYE